MIDLHRFLDDLVQQGRFSAAAAGVARSNQLLWQGAAGHRDRERRIPATARDLFDLASLTKVFVATATLAASAGAGLDWCTAQIADLAPEAAPALGRRRLRALLDHRAGLLPWVPLYHLCRTPAEAHARLLRGDWLGGPSGSYSDLGFVLLGRLLERRLGLALAATLERSVLRPLRLEQVSFAPGARQNVVGCALDTGREVVLARRLGFRVAARAAPRRGRVQDGNARFLRRPAGHAGLFGNAGAVIALAQEWLRPGNVLSRSAVAAAFAAAGPYAGGWARGGARTSAGASLSASAFGHTGFTGGSVWVDPERDLVLVLLGHRTDPHADLTEVRRSFHRAALATLGLSAASARRAAAGRAGSGARRGRRRGSRPPLRRVNR